MTEYEGQRYGTEEICPNNETGHEPDLLSPILITSDGGVTYLDVSCKHCGRSGCLGTYDQLVKEISW